MIRRYHVDRKLFMYEFPVRHGTAAFHTGRKLFAYSFPFGLAPWCFLPTGNCSRKVYCPAWLHAVACPQETVGEGFPVRLDSMVFLTHGKLFAGRFLDSARNDKRTWLHGAPYPQETVREGFPVRLDSTVFLAQRKLFAYSFLFGMAPWCSLPTGNYSPIVSHPA